LVANYSAGIELTESNLISEYLVEKYDTKGIFSVEGEQNKLFIKQWLGFQAASQGPFFAQVNILFLICFSKLDLF
jgi:glutathione S-transferase